MSRVRVVEYECKHTMHVQKETELVLLGDNKNRYGVDFSKGR